MVALAAAVATSTAATLAIDLEATGPVFEGLGGLSGGGGTSRLLFDYAPAQRDEILDALFLPKRGANLQILKVEIGGDAASTEAAEASHMHTPDDENYERGYEWWLMNEAKKRNPEIKLYGLSWGVPAWVANSSSNCGLVRCNYYTQSNIDYHIKWIDGAKAVHNLTIDYMGIWNESPADTDWVVRLRQQLDTRGLSDVQIVAADTGWDPICSQMLANETVRDAISVVGAHYPIHGWSAKPADVPPDCATLRDKMGKPMWTSEGWDLGQLNNWKGAMNLASTINLNYVAQKQTAMIVWSAIYSWYSILPFASPTADSEGGGSVGGMGHGLMAATEPWSGHYRVLSPLYAVAHTTQFTRAGSCNYLKNEAVGSNGWLDDTNTTSLVVLKCSDSGVWSIIIETAAAPIDAFNKTTRFTVQGLGHWNGGDSAVHVWKTNQSHYFEQQAPPPIAKRQNNRSRRDLALFDLTFEVQLEQQAIFTISSSQGQSSVQPSAIPPSSGFPLPYFDAFDSYKAESTVRYFTDQAGSFNAAPAPAPAAAFVTGNANANSALKQVVTEVPIPGHWWRNADPYTLLGDSQSWSNYSVSAQVQIPAGAGAGAGVGDTMEPVEWTITSAATGASAGNRFVIKSFERCNTCSFESSLGPEGQCLDVMGCYRSATSCRDGTEVFVYPCHADSDEAAVRSAAPALNEKWQYVPISWRRMVAAGQLRSMGGAMCATASASSPLMTMTHKCDPNDQEQHWVVTGTGNGPAVHLKHVASGLCLGLNGSNPRYPQDLLAALLACDSSSNSSTLWSTHTLPPAPTPPPPTPPTPAPPRPSRWLLVLRSIDALISLINIVPIRIHRAVPPSNYARVCGRIGSFKTDGSTPRGYCLILDDTNRWFISAGGTFDKGRGFEHPNIIFAGNIPAHPESSKETPSVLVGTWAQMNLTMRGDTLEPSINGKSMGVFHDRTFHTGMAALGCGWHQAFFDDFALNAE